MCAWIALLEPPNFDISPFPDAIALAQWRVDGFMSKRCTPMLQSWPLVANGTEGFGSTVIRCNGLGAR